MRVDRNWLQRAAKVALCRAEPWRDVLVLRSHRLLSKSSDTLRRSSAELADHLPLIASLMPPIAFRTLPIT